MVAVCLALGSAGCGGSDKDDQAGIILQNGNKLRGEDAKAYCRRFPPADPQSRVACEAIGVMTPLSPEERAEEREQAEADQSEARVAAARPLAPAVRAIARPILKSHYVGVEASDTGIAIRTNYAEYGIPDNITAAVCKAVVALPQVVSARSGGKILPIYLDTTDGSAPADCDL
jgi:hypothetical protein